MSQSLKSVLALIKAGLKGNATIDNYCILHFARRPEIYIGADKKSPPEIDGPLILIGIGPRRTEINQQYRNHVIDIAVQIKHDEIQEDDNVNYLVGIDLLDDLADIVERVVTPIFNQNGIPSNTEASQDDEVAYPYFRAVWSYAVRCAIPRN